MALAASGMWATLGPFWSLPTAFLGGAAAAGGIALINAVGNLGGFAGPYAVGALQDYFHNPKIGLYLLAGSLTTAALLAFALPKDRFDTERSLELDAECSLEVSGP